MCIYNIYLNNILASIYTYNYFNNNFILATICTLCEAPESNTIDSGAIQINCIIIIMTVTTVMIEMIPVCDVRWWYRRW